MGRTMNVRCRSGPRQIAERMRHLAAERDRGRHRPARDTSSCASVLTPLRTQGTARGQPAGMGICPGCGWQGDRDQGAWQRIAARASPPAQDHADRRSATMPSRRRRRDRAAAVITAQASGGTGRRPARQPAQTSRACPGDAGTLPHPARAWRPASGGRAQRLGAAPRAARRTRARTRPATPRPPPHRARGQRSRRVHCTPRHPPDGPVPAHPQPQDN